MKSTIKQDNFLRHLTKGEVQQFKDRIFEARKIKLDATDNEELYYELLQYGLISVSEKLL